MNIFFDLDGTLTDPAEGITRCLEYAVIGAGGMSHSRKQLTKYIGPQLRDSLKELLPKADQVQLDRAIGMYRRRYSSHGMFENRLYPDIPRMLDELDVLGHAMWVVTAKPRDFALKILDYLEISSAFRHVYGPALSEDDVPKRTLIRIALDENELSERDTVMVGDRSFDIEAARGEGVYSIGVLWGFGSRDELETAGADLLINSPGDLTGAIQRLGISR
ncbi:MAG: HAD hydrolase-like protein [Spirochaetales bacterium]